MNQSARISFVLNPYNEILYLANKYDRSLFSDGYKGVKPEDVFDGKRQNYRNFVKLIEGDLNGTRKMEALEVYTK